MDIQDTLKNVATNPIISQIWWTQVYLQKTLVKYQLIPTKELVMNIAIAKINSVQLPKITKVTAVTQMLDITDKLPIIMDATKVGTIRYVYVTIILVMTILDMIKNATIYHISSINWQTLLYFPVLLVKFQLEPLILPVPNIVNLKENNVLLARITLVIVVIQMLTIKEKVQLIMDATSNGITRYVFVIIQVNNIIL